jgi:hypothetical protein
LKKEAPHGSSKSVSKNYSPFLRGCGKRAGKEAMLKCIILNSAVEGANLNERAYF